MVDDLILIHNRLANRFRELRDLRLPLGRPVYLLEHGLGPDELQIVTGQLLHALSAFPFDGSAWWRQRFLPVLIVACEVGYEYRGNGTDFWPILENRVQSQFSYEQRQCISTYFKHCHADFACIEPPDTDWARSFCHIAWPITNAVLPLDMRLPFAQTLGRVAGRISRDTDDEAIRRIIRSVRIDYRSQRFESWASTESLVADLARDLLGDEYPIAYLDPRTRDRVVRDLQHDATVRRELRLARQRQRRAKTNRKPEGAERSSPLKGRLFLTRRTPSSFALEGESPPLPQQLRKSLGSVLRSGSWSIQPWGLTDVAPLPPSALLHGTRFNVPLRHLQEFSADQAFLTDLESLPLQSSEREFLARLTFDLRLPMVLSPDDNDSATQRLNRRLTAGEQIWLLVPIDNLQSPRPSGVIELGTVATCQVMAVDLSSTEAGEWVQSIGLSAPADFEWEWLLPPALNPGEEPPCYLSGDRVVLRCRRWPARQASLRAVHIHNGQTVGELTIDAPSLIEIPATASGVHEVTIESDAGLSEQLRFDIVRESDVDGLDVPVIQLSLRAPELAASCLLRGELSLEIAGMRKLENLIMELALSSGSQPSSETLDELPVRFHPGHEIWEKLLTADARDSIARGRDAVLTIRVGNLAERSWLLENQVDELWWEWRNASVRALRDSGEVPIEALSVRSLLVPSHSGGDELDARLFVASDENGRQYEAGGLLVTPSAMAWPADLPRPARLLRQLEDRDDGVGLRKLSSLYLAMANATSAHLVAEMHRRRYAETLLKYVVEVCCGDRCSKVISGLPTCRHSSTSFSTAPTIPQVSRDGDSRSRISRRVSSKPRVSNVRTDSKAWAFPAASGGRSRRRQVAFGLHSPRPSRRHRSCRERPGH
jgi:hypothetical protein